MDELAPEQFLCPDQQGSTLLHSLISYINPHTMPSSQVQAAVLRIFYNLDGNSNPWSREAVPKLLNARNKDGLTPLHLAAKCALPHVVASLLKELGYNNNRSPRDTRLAIAVRDTYGTSLLEDLSSTYWLARSSDEESSLLLEADAMFCVCLISDALAGRLPLIITGSGLYGRGKKKRAKRES
ncbi:hypothetical protein BU23DRAFT_649925 [Bimuria novae-zelandiae CBS 107.79]|uniref:Uncharacterized protein n=1 Tax=Bimuria novae-zelandiae CBS 107.79 TaxID=1447943 RepID=A0A6A5V117_9PLEO|nr:hypothetical protein BU23DRAFT_649925 [Bimuria novae-zelandiae CBS 107.79]